MSVGLRTITLGAICAGILGLTLPAVAQTESGQVVQPGIPAQPVEPAGAPESDTGVPQAIGIPLGGFRLFPTLDLTANYDDNVYRTDTATRDDYYFSESPGFRLQSDWVRHELDVYALLNAYEYATLTHENHDDWDVGGDGRLDIYTGVDLTGGGSYSIQHESRTSPDQPGFAAKPTQFAYSTANALLEYHPYHFDFSVGGTFDRYVYDPTQLIAAPPLNNADRNRDEFDAFVKGSYEFSPGYAVYIEGDDRDVSYDLTLDRNGFRRANDGYAVNTGLDMLVTDLVKGQIFVGYIDEHYHAPLVDVSGFNFGANVDWSASPLWTVHLTASRQLNGTTIADASAEDDQAVRLTVDYSILTNLMIEPHIGYTDSLFNGSGRDDKYLDTGIAFNYSMNDLIGVRLAYDYQDRNSTAAGQGFGDNLITLGLNVHP